MIRTEGQGRGQRDRDSETGGKGEGHRNRGRTDAQGHRDWNKERGIGTRRDETEREEQ